MKFISGVTYIPASDKVFDHHEIDNVEKAAKDGWWTEGDSESIKQSTTIKTKAVMMTHVLGNPMQLLEIIDLAKNITSWLKEFFYPITIINPIRESDV